MLPRTLWRQSTPQPPALNAVGGRVFRRKTRACARGHMAAPDPSCVKCWFPAHRGPDGMGGPGTPGFLAGRCLLWDT